VVPPVPPADQVPLPAVRAPHLRVVPPLREPHPLLARRDPATIRKVFPWLARVTDRYFRAEVEGVEHLSDRASLVVSTHNGAWVMPDALSLFVAYWRHFGLETPAYGMAHRLAFSVPWYGNLFAKLGAIEASRANARIALEQDAPLLVCPGGDVDSCKPFRQRYRVIFNNRRGFIRLAIEQQVPIIPTVSVGAHEVFFILNDGRRLAERTGAARWLRLKTIPMALCFPVGVSPGGVGAIPLPTKVRVRILPRIELAERPEAARDDAIVDRCFRHVRATMQQALDGLASRRRWPVLG
jgi:1-acyl-sn-glycerol-3-phosphate acyltransferase